MSWQKFAPGILEIMTKLDQAKDADAVDHSKQITIFDAEPRNLDTFCIATLKCFTDEFFGLSKLSLGH